MTRPTQIGRTFPLISATALGGAGGSVDGTQPDGQFPGSGQVPTASGSNGWAWASNVALITSNTSNALLGPFVNFQNGSGVTFSVSSNTLTISSTGSASSSLGWFDVTAYGAVGDGSTDDRAAINAAIAAYNAAGGGVLYFPGVATGTYYYVSNALTALTKPGTVLGDGMGHTGASSSVSTDHATAALFTVSSNFVHFQGLGLLCTATTPASGSVGIKTTTGTGAVCSYRSLWVGGFYIGLDLQYGSRWMIDGVQVVDPSLYGIRIANIDLPDGGDWSISNSEVTTSSAATHTPTSAIRQDSAGGGKVVNLKINADSAHPFVTGYDLNINGAANTTTVHTMASCSIENVSGDAIKISTTGTGAFGLVNISALEVALYSNNTGRAVNIVAATNGTIGTNGSIAGVVIDGLTARTDGTARAAISLTNTDHVTLGDMALVANFTSRYTSSGDTNTTDGSSGGVTDHGALTGLADDDHTQYVLRNILTAQGDLFARTSSHITRVAAGSNTGMSLVTDLNYVEGVRWGNTVGEILISDTPAGSPLVFSDLIQNEAQDDLMYADP